MGELDRPQLVTLYRVINSVREECIKLPSGCERPLERYFDLNGGLCSSNLVG